VIIDFFSALLRALGQLTPAAARQSQQNIQGCYKHVEHTGK
jgi:hypothetical protein